jgi:hypothetical protein
MPHTWKNSFCIKRRKYLRDLFHKQAKSDKIEQKIHIFQISSKIICFKIPITFSHSNACRLNRVCYFYALLMEIRVCFSFTTESNDNRKDFSHSTIHKSVLFHCFLLITRQSVCFVASRYSLLNFNELFPPA